MSKEQNKCPNAAEFVVAWGGAIYNVCDGHRHALQAIGSAIGHQVYARRIAAPVPCDLQNDLEETE